MTYGEYLNYVSEAKNYDSADEIRLEYGFPAECEFTADGLVDFFNIVFSVSRNDFSALLSGRKPMSVYRFLNIPPRTAQRWASGENTPSEYIVQLIGYALISVCEKEGD